MSRYLKLALVLPISIVWDVFFFLLETLYHTCSKIDDYGAKKITEFLDS